MTSEPLERRGGVDLNAGRGSPKASRGVRRFSLRSCLDEGGVLSAVTFEEAICSRQGRRTSESQLEMPTKIRAIDLRLIDDLFEMGGGYVLDFSNRTFAEFFADELGVDIDSPQYEAEG